MSKQTAVEWFSSNVWKLTSQLISKEITLGRYAVLYFELHEQAEEMEKEQIMEAFEDGNEQSFICKEGIEYYNETYKKEEKC